MIFRLPAPVRTFPPTPSRVLSPANNMPTSSFAIYTLQSTPSRLHAVRNLAVCLQHVLHQPAYPQLPTFSRLSVPVHTFPSTPSRLNLPDYNLLFTFIRRLHSLEYLPALTFHARTSTHSRSHVAPSCFSSNSCVRLCFCGQCLGCVTVQSLLDYIFIAINTSSFWRLPTPKRPRMGMMGQADGCMGTFCDAFKIQSTSFTTESWQTDGLTN